MLNLDHILGQPWGVTEDLAHLGQRLLEADGISALRLLAEVHREHNAEAAQARAAEAGRRGGNVAVIPVIGLLSHRGGVIDSTATTSTAQLAAVVRSMAAEPSVGAIVLEIDSPGGQVIGTPEAAGMIRSARGAKPVVAVANGIAGSCAYWLMSQADEGFVTPSGRVGGIGVYYPHVDRSGAEAAQGRKVTLISAGKYKTEGNPFEPLSDEARAQIQSEVDEAYSMFTGDVAKGRRAPIDAVRKGYGEGRMVSARQAVQLGMADAVGTIEDAIRRAAALAVERSRAATSVAQLQVSVFRRQRG